MNDHEDDLRPDDLDEVEGAWNESSMDFGEIPAGIYPCRVTAIKPVNTQYGKSVKICLTVVDGDYVNRRMTMFLNLDPNPSKMKFTKIALNIISPEFVRRPSLKAALFDTELIESLLGTIVEVKRTAKSNGKSGYYTNLVKFLSRPADGAASRSDSDEEVPF